MRAGREAPRIRHTKTKGTMAVVEQGTAPSRRIHIIEDDPDSAQVLRLAVEKTVGARVKVFHDGLTGLEACLRDRPDLVITDLGLPRLSGEEICRLLRSSHQHRETPIIVCSGMAEPQRREMDLLGLGANVYLSKPVSLAELSAALREFLPDGDDVLGLGAPRAETAATPAASGETGELLSADLPRMFAGYQIEELLGTGGLGTVYRAKQLSVGRTVALKVLLRATAEDSPEVARFTAEARLMARMTHPNIVRVFDLGRTEHTVYIAREYVEGPSVAELARMDPPWEACADVIRQMLEALAHLHGVGLVHGNVKPQNFFVTDEGVVKLVDIGMCHSGHLRDVHHEAAQLAVGASAYMAPEQMLGTDPTMGSDQYAVACTIMHLLGRGMVCAPPPPLDTVRPELPAALGEALARCTAVNPAERFATMREAADAITAACAEHTAAG